MSKLWKYLTKEEARLRSTAVLNTIPYVPNPETEPDQFLPANAEKRRDAVPAAAPKALCAACQDFGVTLNRNTHRVTEAICEHPKEMIPERGERLNIPVEEDSACRKIANNVGLIESGGSVGNRHLLHLATAKGKKWAHLHGLTVPTWHGSLIHAFITDLTEKKIRLVAPETRFEHCDTTQPGGVRPDSVALLPGASGHRVIIQAVVQHRARDEAINLLKLCDQWPQGNGRDNGAGWIDLVVCAAVNKTVQKSVERAVRDLNSGQMPTNLVTLDVESLLDPAYDMNWIMARDV